MKEYKEFLNFKNNFSDCFKEVVIEDGTLFYEMPVSTVLSYIFNSNGVWQVGNVIYRNSEKYYFSTNSESLISTLLDNELALNSSGIQSYLKNNDNLNPKGQYSYKTVYFPDWNDRRIVARLVSDVIEQPVFPYPIYIYEARTTSQQRHWSGIWVQADIHIVKLNVNRGYYTILSPDPRGRIIAPIEYTKENASNISQDIVENVFYPIDFSNSTCLLNHSGTRYGVTVSIDNNELFPN